MNRSNRGRTIAMTTKALDIIKCILSLNQERPVFHSEADFQFALAWKIQSQHPDADVRLEYCPSEAPNTHIDIVVFHLGEVIPIELKYKTKKLSINLGDEAFNLKNHGAQDLGKYDFVKDVRRLEELSSLLSNCSHGYTIWLTNDPSYWIPPTRKNTVYEAFSIYHKAQKHGFMEWRPHAGAGTIKGRESPIELKGTYDITWIPYSNLNVENGVFSYAVLTIAQ